MAYIGEKTNPMMSGLICSCGHDYVCHAPGAGGCGECNCSQTRVGIVDELVATAPPLDEPHCITATCPKCGEGFTVFADNPPAPAVEQGE